MLAVVKRLLAGKDDAASLEQQLGALRAEGRDASLAIDQLRQERAQAESYELARELDDKIARQQWIVEHCAAAIPELELQLAAVRAADQAAALAKHKSILIGLYPRLKAAILAAVEAQEEVIAARDAAIKEIGEAMVTRNLPAIAFAGLLHRDLVVGVWQRENDRVVADLARQPKPAAIVPTPARAALPAPKPKTKPIAAAPAPRPPRIVRDDAFPVDAQNQLVVFLKAGIELPSGGGLAAIGDQVALPAEQARQLVLRGAADYVPAPAAGGNGDAA